MAQYASPEDEEDEEDEEDDDIPIMDKVAILFVALGQEVAGEVMKFLTDFEIEEITQSIANLKTVTVEMQDKVLEEFEQHLLAGEWISQGGMDFARGALERAVGPRKAQEILDRVASTVSSGFYMLKNVAPEQVAPFITNEHPQTIALILSQLDPAQAAGILTHLPERTQADVTYRIATMENITPAVLKEIEESLEQNLRDILGGNQDVGGPKVVADILNLTGSTVEKNVLDQMDSQDPETAEAVRNLMFVFADISKLSDREIQTLMREVDQKDLVVALKGSEEDVKDKRSSAICPIVSAPLLPKKWNFWGPCASVRSKRYSYALSNRCVNWKNRARSPSSAAIPTTPSSKEAALATHRSSAIVICSCGINSLSDHSLAVAQRQEKRTLFLPPL
jgi:flagellar motor switch protein FliG